MIKARFWKIVTAVLFLSIISINADDNSDGCYYKGMLLVQAGIGLGFYGTIYGNQSIPPLSASVEYGIHNLVSIGGGLGIEGSSYDYSYNSYGWKYTYTYVPIMFRGVFHPFNLPALINKIPMRDKWDAYGGISLGWTIVNFSESAPNGYTGVSGYSSGGSYFNGGLLLGARYYFTKNFGAYVEEGSGFGWFNIGGVYKF